MTASAWSETLWRLEFRDRFALGTVRFNQLGARAGADGLLFPRRNPSVAATAQGE